jgi:hypothetical protein
MPEAFPNFAPTGPEEMLSRFWVPFSTDSLWLPRVFDYETDVSC